MMTEQPTPTPAFAVNMRVMARCEPGRGFGRVAQVGPGPDVYVRWDTQPDAARPEPWHVDGLVPIEEGELMQREGAMIEQKCESCEAQSATTRSANPDWGGYALCADCAAEYDNRARLLAEEHRAHTYPVRQCPGCDRDYPA